MPAKSKKTSALSIVEKTLALGHSPLPRNRHCFKFDPETGKFWFDSVRNPDVGATRRIVIPEEWHGLKPEKVLTLIEQELDTILE